MMHSLRARLVAGVVALSAVGLLLLGGITYAEQRSFLYDRLDQQVRSAPEPLAHALDERPGDRDHGPPGGGPGFGLPIGTYARHTDADGTTRAVIVDYRQNVTARPALPKSLPAGKLVTVPGKEGSPRYRVQVSADPFGGSTLVAVPMRDVDQTLHRLLLVEGLVIAGVLLLLGVLAAIVVRIGLLPLDRMGHTAGAIAGGDLSHRVKETDPRTEVGRLGISLNAMLDRLEKAFAEREASEGRLRQFIADASHELRTPLASIRGYAELFRIGAARERRDTEKAMRRIEDEAQRMGVLVEDLLTLARLDEVRDAEHGDVDLTSLSRDAVDDARVTAPDRDVTLQANGPVCVLGERDQLRQVLGNLVRNALVHTPPSTPIEVRIERAGGQAQLEVRDHGPGLPTDDSDALFERFWRAERGRERGKGGAGLGLAIVAGIVDAHGGSVSARNVEGGGASFVVRLPLSGISEPAPSAS